MKGKKKKKKTCSRAIGLKSNPVLPTTFHTSKRSSFHSKGVLIPDCNGCDTSGKKTGFCYPIIHDV